MPIVGQIERKTQQRVVKLFREQLGYAYLGDWTDREGKPSTRSRAAGQALFTPIRAIV